MKLCDEPARPGARHGCAFMFEPGTTSSPPPPASEDVPRQPDLLLLGYGSVLHGDDGVGPWIADLVERLEWPGVRCRALTQLTPDLAADLSQARAAVFVDASVSLAPGEVQLCSLDPGEPASLNSHRCTPPTLLMLARELYGHAPRGWMIRVGAATFELGQPLSPAVARTRDSILREINVLRAWANEETR